MRLMVSIMMPACLDMTLNDPHQVPRGVEHTNAVSETTVRRTGIDQLRESELFDTAQALKWTRLDDPPNHLT